MKPWSIRVSSVSSRPVTGVDSPGHRVDSRGDRVEPFTDVVQLAAVLDQRLGVTIHRFLDVQYRVRDHGDVLLGAFNSQ